MSAVGYLPYLAFVLLPGIGLGELLGVWKRDDDLIARVGYAFGIGMCVDTVVLVIRTSGVANVLAGLDDATIYATIAVGSAALAISLVKRRRFTWWVRPSRLELGFLGFILIQGLIIALYLYKYPTYPSVYTTDFSTHVRNTLGLLSGENVTIPRGILYDGIYYQLMPSVLLVGGSALTTVRLTMSILALFSPFLMYLLALRLSKSQLCAFAVAALFIVSGPVWFQMIFLLGLYSNFFGILVAVFLLTVFIDAATVPIAVSTLGILAIATITAYFSHYSTVTLFPAIVAFPVLYLLANRKSGMRSPIVATAVVLLPGLIGVATYPHIVFRLFLANRAAVPLTGSSPLSSLIAGWPFLEYMIFRMYSDLAFLVLGALACVFVWKTASTKAVLPSLLIIWFAATAAAAPFDVTAWRYSLEAIVPFTLMAGIGLHALMPHSKAGKGRQNPRSYHWKVAFVLILLVPPVATSWSSQAVTDALNNPGLVREDQSYVNQSITWLGAHTPKNATYLSVSDLWFIYTRPQIDRQTIYRFLSAPDIAIQYAEQIHANYILVSAISSAYQSNSSLYPWNSFPTTNATNSNLIIIYQNPGVRVYEII